MPSNITSVSVSASLLLLLCDFWPIDSEQVSRGIERIIIFGPTGARVSMLGNAYMLLPPATNITLTCAMVFILFPFAS